MTVDDAILREVLSAAQALLAARQDDMVTAEEWRALEYAVANAAGDADTA